MLQFGEPDPALDYVVRPTAFGLVFQDGRLACVRVERGASSYYDLPGGAIDGDETEEQALVREHEEVRLGDLVQVAEAVVAVGAQPRLVDQVAHVGGYGLGEAAADLGLGRVHRSHSMRSGREASAQAAA